MKVELIDKMGTDLSVVNAARVSFHKESSLGYYDEDSKWIPTSDGDLSDSDTKLIHYLAKHNHWSPFAHCFASFRIKAPIFVARQLVKHQVGLAWNEVSRRYVDEEPEFWFPEVWRGRPVNAKQGSKGEVELTQAGTDYFWPVSLVSFILDTYTGLLKDGVAPEQARMVLPLNTMTEWIWSGSLMAFARVCKLRLDPHAQLECSEIAQPIKTLCEQEFPVSFKALMEN